jgi:hypothetical protein
VAEKEEKEKEEEKPASIPWLPLVTLIAVGTGILLFFPQLISLRPRGGNPLLAENTFEDQTVNARLWQDPLGVAIAAREKDQKSSHSNSIMRFQELFIKKCFTNPEFPLKEELRFAEQSNRVQILAVMIPGGPQVDDFERRLRSRRAVIEGLGTAQYYPEEDEEIGYFCAPWRFLDANIADCVSELEKKRSDDGKRWLPIDQKIQPVRSRSEESGRETLVVPYEWYKLTGFSSRSKTPSQVLVLWLTDSAFRDAPLSRLADLFSWFRLELRTAFGDRGFLPLPHFAVLGPDDAETLQKMVTEATENKWNEETKQYLATTHIYSCRVTVAEIQLLADMPALEQYPTCKVLLEEKVRDLKSVSDFSFDRTIFTDDLIVKAMQRELELRGVKNSDHVAFIAEEDAYSSRTLSSTFKSAFVPNVYSYTYLRGIDGKLSSVAEEEKDTYSAVENVNKNLLSSLRPNDRSEGLNQADYIRRLAADLQKLNTNLQNIKAGGLKAVGLLGSDVYDKLELLQAFRTALPDAIFFTHGLDDRLTNPAEWNETHNLLISSAHGLSPPNKNRSIAPFRDSEQTALFEATLQSLGQIHAEDAGRVTSPLIFEVSRTGPKEIDTRANPRFANAELFTLLRNLGSLGSFLLFGILLLAWTRLSLNPSKAERVSGAIIASDWRRQQGRSNSILLPIFICAVLAVGVVSCFYILEKNSGRGMSFAWFDGTSAWPSIGLIFFAAFLCIHFIARTHFKLRQNAAALSEEFALRALIPEKTSLLAWEAPPLIAGNEDTPYLQPRIDISILWQRYLSRGRFWRRMFRTIPMAIFYLSGLGAILPL